jgi:ankyrin repeat protein
VVVVVDSFQVVVCLMVFANARSTEEKQTAFMMAAAQNHLECMKLLHESLADIEAVDVFGHDALKYAELQKHQSCVDYIHLARNIIQQLSQMQQDSKTSTATVLDGGGG